MACNITSGWEISCKDSQGGIVKIYIANGPVEAYAETAGVLTSVTVAGSPLTPADFFEFEVPKQTSSLVENVTASTENGPNGGNSSLTSSTAVYILMFS